MRSRVHDEVLPGAATAEDFTRSGTRAVYVPASPACPPQYRPSQRRAIPLCYFLYALEKAHKYASFTKLYQWTWRDDGNGWYSVYVENENAPPPRQR